MAIIDPINELRSLLSDSGFNEFVTSYDPGGPYTTGEWAGMIVSIFNLKSWIQPVVKHYLESGEIDASLANDPVTVEAADAKNLGEVKLVLAPDITQPELKNFIISKWSTRIKPHLYDLPYNRHTIPAFPELDEAIYQEYLNKHKSGLNNVGIALKYNRSVSTVNRIIRRKKRTL